MAAEGDRVVVIGAGIAGLVTAKVLRDDGFDVTVVEREATIGGVWAEVHTYPGLRTNNSRDTYAYSDHPYDRSADVFPTADQVRRYLDSYVSRFGLAPLIRLSTTAVRVARRDSGFEAAVRGPDGSALLPCDFVVVAVGTYCEPHIPEIVGGEHFAGTVVHSSRAIDPALAAGKRVVVVGAGKSALDCAAWAARLARRCTLVFRAPHWMAPRFLPSGTPADRLVLGRLPEMFLRYHRLTGIERVLHGPGRIPLRLFWRALGDILRRALRMPAVLVPDRPMPHGIESLGLASEFYELAHEGRIDLRRNEITAFADDTRLLLSDGRYLDADVVIFGTGWRQDFGFLAPDLHAAVVRDGRFQLYRHILPPTERRLGFIGYASSTACQLSSEISAHWLSHVFRGECELPTVDEMNTEIRRVHAWLADTFPACPQGHFIGPHLIHHIDDLLTDMAVPTRRTGNVFAEYLSAFSPARYRDVAAKRRLARADGRLTARLGDTNADTPDAPLLP
ncbi:NAD(P)/FAD-dependent oxidoreductase [Nocardia terpenica]|uniref:flavin-containing monooxygenase n=1 Tax=Nocardia terpenica TaxID=455432 RepID=UPI002FE32407